MAKENIIEGENIKRQHLTAPTQQEVDNIAQQHDFHDIIREDMLETSTQDKIDVYDDYIFMIIHFPKYSKDRQKYILNELTIVLGKDFLFTVVRYETSLIAKIKKEYETEMKQAELPDDEKYKISPYYILYKLLDGMYDKVLRSINKFNNEVIRLEEKMFDNDSVAKDLLENLMIKRRNSIFLKHTFNPHLEIVDELHEVTMRFFKGELDVYFEDLEYKVDKITNQMNILNQNIAGLADTYNTLMNMKTNTIVGVLAIFTAIVGTMTFVTGLYGMNVALPGEGNTMAFFVIGGILIILATLMIRFFRKKRWI